MKVWIWIHACDAQILLSDPVRYSCTATTVGSHCRRAGLDPLQPVPHIRSMDPLTPTSPFYSAATMYAFTRLGVADVLAAGPREGMLVEDIAAQVSCRADSISNYIVQLYRYRI